MLLPQSASHFSIFGLRCPSQSSKSGLSGRIGIIFMISETDLSEHICRRYIELPARSRRLAESRENTGTCFAINRLALVVWNPGNLFNCDNASTKLPTCSQLFLVWKHCSKSDMACKISATVIGLFAYCPSCGRVWRHH